MVASVIPTQLMGKYPLVKVEASAVFVKGTNKLFSVGAQPFSNAYFGRGTGPLLLYGLHCTGREQYLLNCSHSGVGVTSYYCGYYHDAGVRCQGNLPVCMYQFYLY